MRYFPTIELRGSKCTPEWYLLQPEMEVSFKDDPNNVLIACQGQTLGYLPNSRIANLVRDALAKLEQKTFAFIKSIDETSPSMKKEKSSSWVWPSIKK